MNSWGLEHADRTGTHAAMADVVDAIGTTPTGPGDRPREDQVITGITIEP